MAARKIEMSNSSSTDMVSSSVRQGYLIIDESPLKKPRKDMISDLPDYILDHILSFLSTKDAVKTSILATNWRYLWTNLTLIDFDMLSTREIRSPQHRTRVSIRSYTSYRSDLYTSSLTELSLKLAKTIPTTGIQFLNLKTLNISYATFTSHKPLEQFLSRCPLLQDLTLNYCYLFDVKKITIAIFTLRNLTIHFDPYCFNSSDFYNYSVEIDAVNLLSFTCTSVPAIQFLFVNPWTSILDAYIGFDLQIPQQQSLQQRVPPCSLLLLTRLAGVKSLTLSSKFFDPDLYPVDHLHLPMYQAYHLHLPELFRNLTHLCLDLNMHCPISKLMGFLLRCPNLEVLVLPLSMRTILDDFREDLLIPVPPCFKSSLKSLHISNFDGYGIGPAKYLLENARLLDEIRITWSPDVKPKMKNLIASSSRYTPRMKSIILSHLNMEDLKNQLVGMGSCSIKFE